MASRKPLVVIAGQMAELPAGDSIAAPISPIEQAIVTLPDQTTSHEGIVARVGTTVSQSVRCWLGSTVDTDENDLWQLEGVLVSGLCGVDQITFFVSCQTFESGPIKISYQVQ
jgi:hypothetical protein